MNKETIYKKKLMQVLTLATSAFDGEHEYLPESAKSAFCISKYDVVTSPFSVITDTPPLVES